MVFQKRTINNVPTLVPLTADTGSGAPLGTIHGFYKKGSYPGYLYLDGSTFDQTLYPALYAYLGTNVLPDYREFVLVGAEQNTTSTVINQIEHTHDVFTQGEEKDDQLQYHEHLLIAENPVGSSNDSVFYNSNGAEGINDASLKYSGGNSRTAPFKAGTFNRGRYGTTTRTKEKAVFWYIKATTGISESEATDVLNLYNEQNSYSTSEINTGKKWIDGKPIYRKVFHYDSITVDGDYKVLDNVDTLVNQGGCQVYSGFEIFAFPWTFYNKSNDEVERLCFIIKSNALYRRINYNNFTDLSNLNWWVEYTKTTD